jgi:DNA polymerase
MGVTSESEGIRAVALQHAEWAWLLGLDVIPKADSHATPVASPSTPGSREAEPEIMSPPRSQSGVARDSSIAAAAPKIASASASVTVRDDEKAAALVAIHERHDATCPHCTSVTGHEQTVFGEGNADANLMFIGEAPGAEEDRTGRPFVGRAGQKLDEIIGAMGLQRADVYIANILKSRPPDNRTPLTPEIAACAPFLAEQIAVIRPRVIVALGGPATKFLLDTTVGITRLRGQWACYVDSEAEGGAIEIPIMPTFHPAYLLRNYTAETRGKVWSDMQAVMSRLG